MCHFHHILPLCMKLVLGQAQREAQQARTVFDHLIGKGADVNITDANGKTPLDYVGDDETANAAER